MRGKLALDFTEQPRNGPVPPWAPGGHSAGLPDLGEGPPVRGWGQERNCSYGWELLSPTPNGSWVEAQPPNFPPALRVFSAALYGALPQPGGRVGAPTSSQAACDESSTVSTALRLGRGVRIQARPACKSLRCRVGRGE